MNPDDQASGYGTGSPEGRVHVCPEVRTEKPFNCHCMFLTSRNRQDGSNFSCGNWGSEQVSGLPRGHALSWQPSLPSSMWSDFSREQQDRHSPEAPLGAWTVLPVTLHLHSPGRSTQGPLRSMGVGGLGAQPHFGESRMWGAGNSWGSRHCLRHLHSFPYKQGHLSVEVPARMSRTPPYSGETQGRTGACSRERSGFPTIQAWGS